MASINKVMLIGRLGKDPEMRYTPSGAAVASFSMATSETWRDKDGVKQEDTQWHNCVAWGKLGEICGEYLHKGSLVYIEGKLKTESWEKGGEKHYATKIVITSLQMLDGKKQEGGKQAPDQGGGSIPEDDIPF